MRLPRSITRLTAIGVVYLAALGWLCFGALPIAKAASITVTDLCSLVNAITAANTDSNSHNSHCTAGSGADTINFAFANQTVVLGWELIIQSDITINGNGTTLDGQNGTRVFTVAVGGSLQLDNITLTKAYSENLSGGAIRVSPGASLTVTNSAFTSNRAGAFGGAIYSTGNINISNSTLYNNEASVDTIDGSGGAIAIAHTSNNNSNIITHVTMRNNKGKARGTAIRVNSYRSRLSLRNSIIVSSGSSFSDCHVGSISMWERVGNVIGSGSEGCISNKTKGDLGSSTGNPLYFPLKRSSEAIGAGDDAICAAFATDRLGKARPQTGCDAGAVEHSLNSPVTPTPVPTTAAPIAERISEAREAELAADPPRVWVKRADGKRVFVRKGESAKPVCSGESLNENTDPRVWATYGLCSGVQFKRLEAGWLTGNQRVIDAGFIDGVDVWGYAEQGVEVCFPAYGAVVLLDAATSPRTLEPLDAYLDEHYTCAAFNKAGTAVLVDANSGLASAPASGPAPAGLSGCMVTTTHILNLRAEPNGNVIGMVAHNATLTALSRTDAWFEVDANGVTGWISADYVTTAGACG